MRLVDAHKIRCERDDFDTYADYIRVFDMIADAQTVDAVPIMHAKLLNAHPYGECSNCGQLIDARDKFNYCPMCGASLRGKKNEID